MPGKYRVRRQVIIPLTLTFAVLLGTFIYASYQIRLDDYASSLENRYQRVQQIFASLTHNRSMTMLSIAEIIADRHRFQDAMLNADREMLLHHGSTLFQRISSGQNITHFYFHDQSGNTFLRVYQPERVEAASMRYTKLQAIQSDNPFWGLELGSTGTFTLRLVYPWHMDDELLGYIELGQEIDQILQELKTITHIDFLITINKEHLEQSDWENGMQMLGRTAEWDLLAEQVVVDHTLELTNADTQRIMNSELLAADSGLSLNLNQRNLRARSFPLPDASGKIVGEFVMFKDMTDEVRAFRIFIITITTFSLTLCLGLFIFAYIILGRTDRRLHQAHQQLQLELDNQASTNMQLEKEVRERKRAEENLGQLNEALEERVRERTQELHQLNQDLQTTYRDLQAQQTTILQQDKMACIGQLAAGIAHDINNPIGFVSGNLEVLHSYSDKLKRYLQQEQELAQKHSPQLWEQLHQHRQQLRIDMLIDDLDDLVSESLEGTERVSRIVLNLKGFARLDDTGEQLADIHECLESTLGIVANELHHKAEVVRDYAEVPLVRCYPQQLNQVFMNLLINAAQAIEQWGTITISTRRQGNQIVVSISDTGPGVPADLQQKIFEPFYTTKPVGVGTGLGLSIVQEIIHRHGGTINVKSCAGEGTAFTMILPVSGAES
ncbi:ATP-binding protein [Desulfurispira natronophila]|uniref:histidine kinase n=1 Tax=Desulfurispira natronophila TaxID=682562 RepID=A0A7W7Y372_9BACT|nr:ATP-binding protein [Desulfurispira natronophila]MBB5021266.1 signal transduction histidine kinase [Desulfurispira natronophila]